MEISTSNLSHWQVPQRQSPAAILIMLWGISLKLLKALWPILILYLFKNEKDNDSLMMFWIIIGFSALSLTGAIIGYWFKKFHIKDETLIIESGWLKKKTLSIPVQSIQAVHLEQNIWQQMMKVAKVSFDSTGSGKAEVKLDALSMEKAEQLKHLLMEKVNMEPAYVLKKPLENQNKYTLDFADLVRLSLTANHLEAFFILLALGLNIFNEVEQIFDGSEYIDSYSQQLIGPTVIFLCALFIGVAIISILFSFIRTMVQFYGFELMDSGMRWTISFGLFDRTKKIIPINKIQILSWRANWLRRKFDYWTLHVQSVGHQENRKSNIQIPVTSFDRVIKLAKDYQEFFGIEYAASFKIEPDYWKRKSLKKGLPFTLLPMIIAFYWIGWQALGLMVIFPFLIWYYYRWYQHFRWQTNERGIQILSGFFGRKFTLLSWKKIQQVHIHQNLYQRNHQLANVIFITAGGKVSLPYLSLSTARALVDHVLYDVESKEESWM
ncbi:MAG: PH domain-containing protein [Anditalea sp.]